MSRTAARLANTSAGYLAIVRGPSHSIRLVTFSLLSAVSEEWGEAPASYRSEMAKKGACQVVAVARASEVAF